MRRLRSIMRIWLLVMLCLRGVAAWAQDYVVVDGTVDTVMVLPKLGGDSAYLVRESMQVVEEGMLQIEAGVKMYFMQSAFLRVNGGSLLMNGTVNDSIYLMCYEFSHDWAGVQLLHIAEEDTVSMAYVTVVGALAALSSSNSNSVSVSHCTFNNYYAGRGIELVDCSNFIVDSCFFSRCNSGIELKAKTEDCENNRFSHCIFDQGQINIEVSNAEYGSKCNNTVISDNCFQGAATAISFESVGGLSDKDATNYILNNLISSELPQGGSTYSSYGIKVAMDSLVIRNNVFWSNDEAVRMMRVCSLFFEGNTFYENDKVITNLMLTGAASFINNTISEPKNRMVTFPSGSYKLNNNNILHHRKDITLFVNNSKETVDMRANFWDTQSPDEIERLIHHKNDNPTLGEVLYDGYLPGCDLAAPVSPPFRVKKQYLNGEWLISWDDNPEADFDHYVLFYGDFNYYKFAHHIDSITEPYLFVSPQQTENVAVMACSGAYNPDVYASSSQSAYAFAVYYPYAGEDEELCAPDTSFTIGQANIPYTYNRFVWRTSGTGIFSDSLALHTIYFPSANDFNEGEVTLSLHVFSNGEERQDEMHLQLFGQLAAFAGEDFYSGLDRPIVLEQAEAAHYDSLAWHSLGDGQFEDSLLLNAVYYLGEQDIEQRSVSLVIEAWSFCDYVSDTVHYDLFEEFSLEGRTWLDGVPRPNTQVLVAAMNDGNSYFSGFYRTISDAEGNFKFASLLPDTYIMYAFPDTLDMTSGGAYYLGRMQWSESNMIVVDGNVYDIDIQLFETQSDFGVGLGSISGVFDYPESGFKAHDFYCESWFGEGEDISYCIDGLSNVAVLLLNATKQRLLAFALTDAHGRFSFSALPFGTYYVLSDLPRYGRGMVERVELSPQQPTLSDLHLFVTTDGKVATRTKPNELGSVKCAVYPNPAENTIMVSGLQHIEDYSVTVTDMLGNVVVPICWLKSDMVGECSFSVSGLSAGVYFVVVNGASGREILKFVKY